MPHSPSEPPPAERAGDAEDVPSLDQLRWMLRHDGAAVASEPVPAGNALPGARNRLGWLAPARLCGGLALLTIAAAALAFIGSSDPVISAAGQSAVAPVPGQQIAPLALHSNPAPPVRTPMSPAPVKFAAVPAAAATPVARAEGAMTPAPWAIAPTLSLLLPDIRAAQDPAIGTASPGVAAQAAQPPQVMPDTTSPTALPTPPNTREQPSRSVAPAHRAATRLAFHHRHPHGHHVWRAASWQYPGYARSGDGLSYYFLRGSARAF